MTKGNLSVKNKAGASVSPEKAGWGGDRRGRYILERKFLIEKLSDTAPIII